MTDLQVALMRGRMRDFQTTKPIDFKITNPVDIPQIPVVIEKAPSPPDAEVEALPRFITVASIRKLVCLHYGIAQLEMNSKQRGSKLIRPRHIAIYLSTRLTNYSLPRLGKLFGGRDHTTIMHARDSMAAKRLVDPKLDAELAGLECRLRGQVG
jgi:chromosomal replication initiator protein